MARVQGILPLVLKSEWFSLASQVLYHVMGHVSCHGAVQCGG